MKKLIFSLVLAFLMLIFTANIYSTCPDGYRPATFIVTIGGCEYTVGFCFKCASPAPSIGLIIEYFQKNDPNCSQSISTDELLDSLNYELDTHFFLCDSCQIPPCDEDYIVVLRTYAKCWYKENNNGTIIYHNCHTYDCCKEETWCEGPNGPEQKGAGIPYWCNQTTDCTDSEPANPRSGYSTGCFHLWTPCQ